MISYCIGGLHKIPENEVYMSEHIPICGNITLIRQQKKLLATKIHKYKSKTKNKNK